MFEKKNLFLILILIFCILSTTTTLTTFGKNNPFHYIGSIGGISNETELNEHFNCIKNCEFEFEPPKNCRDAMKTDISKIDGIYLLSIPYFKGLAPFGVYCERYGRSGWTIIQRRQSRSQDFYRDWYDYKNGFGNLNENFWIGLERIFAMTAYRSHELMILWLNDEDEERYARYSQFNLASEEEDYRLSVSGYSGDAEDALSYYNTMRFSTYDHGAAYKCAQLQRNGWWHNNCDYNFRYASLNGQYQNYSNETGEGIYWFCEENFQNLKYVHMAIRPRYGNAF